MSGYARIVDSYHTQRIMSASPEQQAALIMEAGQMHLGKAIHALAQNDLPSATQSFLRFSEVIMEANLRLNHEEGGELVQNLERYYGFWMKEVMHASYAKDQARLAAVAASMGEIRQAWEQLHEKRAKANPNLTFQLGDQVG